MYKCIICNNNDFVGNTAKCKHEFTHDYKNNFAFYFYYNNLKYIISYFFGMFEIFNEKNVDLCIPDYTCDVDDVNIINEQYIIKVIENLVFV